MVKSCYLLVTTQWHFQSRCAWHNALNSIHNSVALFAEPWPNAWSYCCSLKHTSKSYIYIKTSNGNSSSYFYCQKKCRSFSLGVPSLITSVLLGGHPAQKMETQEESIIAGTQVFTSGKYFWKTKAELTLSPMHKATAFFKRQGQTLTCASLRKGRG